MTTASAASGLPPVAFTLIGDEYGPGSGPTVEVTSPATGRPIGSVALSDTATVERAVRAAQDAFPAWAATPATQRARLLLKLVGLLGAQQDEIAALITLDNGKTHTDARAEVARTIEHLEAAATAPALLMGDTMMDVLPSLDASVLREPLGVSAVVSPFNFPIMTGSIYWSWALACGNTVVINPSEQAPYAASQLGRLVREAGFPPGVVNIIHGGREAVEALCDSSGVATLSLVGSSATAKAVYARASVAGKRVHTAGGARNPLVVMPDADPAKTADAVVTSAYTMAGQRCLSASILMAVGGIHDELVDQVADRTRQLVTGAGDDEATQVPPLISRQAVDSLSRTIDDAISGGVTASVDGRDRIQPEGGYFHGPTLLIGADPLGPLVTQESFGPLVSVVQLGGLDEALSAINSSPFGNAASIFTESGAAARHFTKNAEVGNIGINLGVAAPTAQFAFGGRRRSFMGSVHSQGRHAVEFYTDVKSVSARWI